ncbi:type II secretion system protein GspC [Pseudidiomarina insulisalsae]|uniref:Type II secretion system protein GspC n=1 Tax=Pseudidiomarina insulisalsae TaxID=575789 RepID=A0A432YNK9_9GAMM|nr:type II secretion system protein GspC [Pseudidiomarina insulisalsae]RUO62581.1 type II secretion system protein GspC [Pseudidiomarina insulisalsae]
MPIENPQLKRFASLAREPRVLRAGLWLLTALFAVYAVWLLAQLTWQLLAPTSTPASGPLAVQVQNQTSERETNLTGLARLDLFGTTVVTASDTRNAPKTQLNVRLLGVSASTIPERSAAIIEKDRRQEVYVIGDKISGTQVSIEEIYADRVILNNNGVLETLELEGIGELSEGLSLTLENQQRTAANTEEEPPMSDARLREVSDAQQAYRDLRRGGESAALLDYIRISPAMSSEGLQGYRLSPGKYPELFTSAGFKTGDIAVAINGQDLTDVASAQVAIGELRNARQIIVTVLRDEEYLDLELAVPSE